MMITGGLEARDWPLVQQKLGIPMTEDTKGIVVIDESGVVAGVVLQMWTHTSVIAHIWIDKPMAIRHLFPAVVDYVFETAGREKIIGLVRSDDPNVIAMDKKIGFQQTYVIKDGYQKGVDWVMLEAGREELSRWFKNGQEGRTAAA